MARRFGVVLRDIQHEVLANRPLRRYPDGLWQRVLVLAVDDRSAERACDGVGARGHGDRCEPPLGDDSGRDSRAGHRIGDGYRTCARRSRERLASGSRSEPERPSVQIQAADQLGRSCRDEGLAPWWPPFRRAGTQRVDPKSDQRSVVSCARSLSADRLNRGPFHARADNS